MDMQNITKITLCWELFESGMPKLHIASRLEINRDTVRLWIKGIQEFGFLKFLDQYTKAKKGERVKSQVDPILKRWVWEIRERDWNNINLLSIIYITRKFEKFKVLRFCSLKTTPQERVLIERTQVPNEDQPTVPIEVDVQDLTIVKRPEQTYPTKLIKVMPI